MKKTTRILSLALVVLMCCSFCAVAEVGDYHNGGSGAFYTISEKPICAETKTYTVAAKKAADSCDWEDMWCFDYIRDELGIDFEFTCIEDTIWTEKLNLMFQSDEVPDLFLNGLESTQIVTYGADFFMDLTDLIAEYAPNIQAVFDNYPDVKKAITTPDGAIYCIPKTDMLTRDLTRSRPYMNVQWLENLGLEIPTTTEELFNVMMAIKEQDADGDGDTDDEIVLAGRYEGEWDKFWLLAAFGFANDEWDLKTDAAAGEEVYYVPADDNYYAFLQFMNKLWTNGLIDPEFFSQTEDQLVAKESSKSCFMFSTWGANWTLMPAEEDYKEYTMISPITSEVNDKQIWPARSMSITYSICINNQLSEEEAIPLVKLANWLYTIEGEIVIQYGPELGELDDLNGWKWKLNDEGYACMETSYDKDKYTTYNNFRIQAAATMRLPYCNVPMVYEDAKNENGDPIPMNFYTLLIPTQVTLTNDTLNAGYEFYTTSYPDYIMTTVEENERIAQLNTDIKAYKNQMTAKFINGEEELTEENFAAYIQGLKDRGLDEFVQLKQDLYNRYIAG